MMLYLRNSIDRCGGRKKRENKKKALTNENVNPEEESAL